MPAPTATNNHDPALTHPAPNQATTQPSQPSSGVTTNMQQPELSNVQLGTLDQTQIMNLLRHLPHVFNKLTEQGKEDAAQTLSNLAQAPFAPPAQHQQPAQQPAQQQQPTHPLAGYPGVPGLPGINDPGPSSHPRGPPNLGQLSAVAMQAAPAPLVPGQMPPHPHPPSQQPQHPHAVPPREDGAPEDAGPRVAGAKDGPQAGAPPAGSVAASAAAPATTGRRGARSAAMGTDEWTRQRKDNHKEVERRRRGNINEGINELGRIVPNGNGEKAKGAILSRAVQYIHHLKENEARNIEKWTLEKLLMDQAMGDLQAQLEEMKRLWDEERAARQRAESELDLLRRIHGLSGAATGTNAGTPNQSQVSGPPPATSAAGKQSEGADAANGSKRRNEDIEVASATEGAENERDGKRQRTE
ncbi:hypothetical protein AMATHDRAFT_61224 [Amanita thiersii Skay4041]|uniref:BHLH domain-containing protein n=1 Tax=Amanita thiersii Skay4041 TaxID=703135 RepID=A0A2A9NIH5_9AGAR|nr:hypothetical protein AMATHDRAFT_61224 [Amanita thiersii Skay4041]